MQANAFEKLKQKFPLLEKAITDLKNSDYDLEKVLETVTSFDVNKVTAKNLLHVLSTYREDEYDTKNGYETTIYEYDRLYIDWHGIFRDTTEKYNVPICSNFSVVPRYFILVRIQEHAVWNTWDNIRWNEYKEIEITIALVS